LIGQEVRRELDLQNGLQRNSGFLGIVDAGHKLVVPDVHISLRNSAYVFTPTLRRMVIMGHQFVNADWNRFKPTKAVKRNQ
jgi:hypothetical protein